MKKKISDLHVHSGLKGFANDGHPGYENFTIWDYYPVKEEPLKKLNPFLKGAIKDLAKDSQANLDACVEANLKAPFLAIYPVERQIFAFDPQKPFKTLFSVLLSGNQHAYLGSAVSGFPLAKVRQIMANFTDGNDDGVNYYGQFRMERDYLLRQTETVSRNFPEYQFKIASNYGEFNTLVQDEKTICGLFTVEGAHSFAHYLYDKTFKKEYEQLNGNERLVLQNSLRNNITEVKTEAGGKHAPFFVTFCHHFNNLLAGHARSFSDKSKLAFGLNLPGLRHLFNQEPGRNRGFTSLGKEILELFLDRKSGRRILIDTKHMSIETRREFYQVIRKKREEENDHIPIINSHAAINGWLTLDHAKNKEETADLDKGHFFSRWQINLTNEDILETYDSDGIIGLVLHEGRMPGEGFNSATKKLKKKIGRARNGSAKQNRLKAELKDMYLKLMWSNIFHIVQVISDGRSKNGWKMIALGSDYDGLIDPMDSYTKVTGFNDLRSDLVTYLQSRKEIFFSFNGEARTLPQQEVSRLMFGQTAEELVDGILFENTNQFLSKYFTEQYLSSTAKPGTEIAVAA